MGDDGATLFEIDHFGNQGRLVALRVTIHGDDDGTFDGTLELYVGQDDEPRAGVRLRDVLAQGGIRPLNVRVAHYHPVRLVLREVQGTSRLPALTIELEWV